MTLRAASAARFFCSDGPHGCNVVALGNDKVLSTAASKNLNARLRAQEFEVYDPNVTMFTRGGGGVHCMAQALRRDPL